MLVSHPRTLRRSISELIVVHSKEPLDLRDLAVVFARVLMERFEPVCPPTDRASNQNFNKTADD